MFKLIRYLLAILAIAVLSPAIGFGRITAKFADNDEARDQSQLVSQLVQPDPIAVEDTQYFEPFDDYYAPRNWASAEYLLWWTKGNQLPALVTTSPAGTARVAAGVLPAATTLFGNEQIDHEARNGMRFSFGHWADADRTIGIQASYAGIFDDNNTGDFTAGTLTAIGAGGGAPILARPFYNISLNQEDSELVSFPNVVDGTISVNSSSEIHTVSALLRQFVRGGDLGRIDFVYGYRYFRLRDALIIREGLVSTEPVGLVPIGTTFALEDRFQTQNDFHGGELGFITEFWRGYWTVDFLAKVALGNLRRNVTIDGSTVTDVPPAGGGAASSGGLLALPTNIGSRTTNEFGALPEFAVNLKFEPSDTVMVQIGYSLLMLDNVSRTGDQMDRIVNPTQLGGGALVGAARPTSLAGNETGFWAQGMNVGITFLR